MDFIDFSLGFFQYLGDLFIFISPLLVLLAVGLAAMWVALERVTR